MSSPEILELDIVADAIREGRPLRAARGYRIQFAQGDVNFRPVIVPEATPRGRQILEAAGLDPKGDFSLFGVLPSGDFEDVRLDEPFDLRGRGAESFIAFLTDRDFKLTLNGAQLAWGKPVISGAALYALGKVGAHEAVFLVERGQPRLVEPAMLVDLAAPGIEHFVTGPKPPSTYLITVNSREESVPAARVTFEQVVQFAFPGPHGPNIVFAVTYRHAASVPHAGQLGPRGFVDVKHKGTIFNVTKTDKS